MASGLTEEDLLEPHPDIHALFVHYNELYFENALGGVSVEWSSRRMTSCGGTCQSVPGGAVIKLSQPLLTLRPAKDIKMVLLHEMIHAYCMVKRLRDSDPGGHGAPFQMLMNKINTSTVTDFQRPPGGYNITITHSMFHEVNYYRQHHWRCERCGNEVKRAMNRKPQEADCRWKIGPACSDSNCRWHMHLKHCGGEFIKVKEPEGYKQGNKGKRKRNAVEDMDSLQGRQPQQSELKKENDVRLITEWVKTVTVMHDEGKKEGKRDVLLPSIDATMNRKTESHPGNAEISRQERCKMLEAAALRRLKSSLSIPERTPNEEVIEVDISCNELVSCPLCGIKFESTDNVGLNAHLDICLCVSNDRKKCNFSD